MRAFVVGFARLEHEFDVFVVTELKIRDCRDLGGTTHSRAGVRSRAGHGESGCATKWEVAGGASS